MSDSNWQGEERRQHDEACAARMEKCAKQIKEWVRDQICLATKPGKVRNTLLWGAIIAMLLSTGLSTVKSIAQDGTVAHNKEEITEVKEDHKVLVQDVNTMKSDIGQIKGYMKQQTQILKALAREHGIPVEIQ